MTHTLHRQSRSRGDCRDWTVLCMAADGFNRQGAACGLRCFLEIAREHNPVNMGDIKTGNWWSMPMDELLANIADNSIPLVVFRRADSLAGFIAELKEAALGYSVVVSGPRQKVVELAEEIGLSPHTMALSLGVGGRLELLPRPEVLEISTLCGHGLVPERLIEEMAGRVRRGEATMSQAVSQLAKPCVCGAFNPALAVDLLKALAD